MHKRVLVILEYDKILAMLKGHTVSGPGGEAAMALRPVANGEEAARLLAETAEAQSMLFASATSPVGAFSDVSAEIKRLKAGASLNCAELLRLNGVMKAAQKAAAGIAPVGKALLYDIAQRLWHDEDLIRAIDRCIVSEDALSDDASPKLRAIRRGIQRENERIRERLNAYIRDPSVARQLQDTIVTLRQGRFVIPVKQEHKSAIPGIVHDQSASGQTLFIEPMPVVEANNRLRVLEAEERAEAERILGELSQSVRSYADEIGRDADMLARLDVAFAKARLAGAMRAEMPLLNDAGALRIREGRHPLIEADRVVPVTVTLDGCRGLVITGPNTGGKTVTLKMAGLLQLMAQSGLFIPAAAGSTLPVFRRVFADIGDEQSIEQSLSTFSSHMKQIITILRYAGGDSLVLLDELGAGTDPAEGAALAMSVLEELARKGAAVLATTHFSEIKAFALSSGYYENAGMEFNVDSLSPTYRLFIGIPGVSNAFKIAEKLGLKKHVIERAKSLMSEEALRFNEIISQAEAQRELAEKERREAETLRSQSMQLSDRLTAQERRITEKAGEMLRRAKEEAHEIVRAARDEAETVIGELKKTAAATPADVTRAAEKARKRLRLRMDALQPARAGEKGDLRPGQLLEGTSVRILSLGTGATVLKKPDAKGNVYVQAGVMKLTVRLDDLKLAEEAPKKSYRTRAQAVLQERPASLDIDLRGRTLDDALIALDKYLDDAFLNGLNEVTVIHGKGTGALRAGIREFLKKHPHAGSFRDGRFGEGETGVTVVSLK